MGEQTSSVKTVMGGNFGESFFFIPSWYSSVEKQPRHPNEQITTILYKTVHYYK